ncbi:MAG: acyl-CoA thioesterase [Mycobacteriaceae bacterium]
MNTPYTKPQLPSCEDFPVLWPVPTRWSDNDHYGHVNNVTYYSYFDTAVNAWLIQATGTDIRSLDGLGVVAKTSCHYLRELSFPDLLQVGIACHRLGSSSISYRLAIFLETPNGLIPAATGEFIHVYIDRTTRTPIPIPEVIREVVDNTLVKNPS